ncbi:MAG: FtsX-like permease family protein [Azospirillaceae bacterium]
MVAGRLLAPLDRKLLRDLWHVRGQIVAIALVIAAGIATMVMASGTLNSLTETRQAYYERNRFADIFAHARRAPAGIVDDIARIEGVSRVSARIVQELLVDMPAMDEPVRGRVISLPRDGDPRVNDFTLRTGREPREGYPDEVVVLQSFADAHGLEPGDTITANFMGTRRHFVMVGTALSPEFIYAIAPGSFVPDDRRFGVFWMNERVVEAASNLEGAVNDIVVQIRRDAAPDDIIRQIDTLLEPFGGTGAYARTDQPSHAFIEGELDQLSVLASIVPPVFLAVAAFLLNLVVGRLIDTEREQIGLLKAFGYGGLSVGWHYVKFVLAIGVVGVVIGMVAGIWLGHSVTRLYTGFFHFPFLHFRLDFGTAGIAVAASLTAAVLGAALSIRRAMVLAPAIAMRPPPPTSYRRGLLERAGISSLLGAAGRMVVRHVLRTPVRSALTSLGVAFSVALLISSLFFLDSIDRMLEIFFEDTQYQDLSVSFVERRGDDVANDLLHIAGVLAVDLHRSAPVRLTHGTRSERLALTGRDPQASLSRLLDADGDEIVLPGQGITLSNSLATSLDVEVGDILRVEVLEGRRPVIDTPVTLIVREYVGANAYMRRDALNRLLQEPPSANAADLAIDPGFQETIYAALTESPQVLGVDRRAATLERFRALIDDSMVTTILFYIGFASTIAVGVVYNSARISLAERGRELASMRVLGYHRHEVALILVGELALLVAAALPVGCVLGYFLARGMATEFASDLFRLPFIVYPSTFAFAAIIVIAASIGAALLVVRRVSRLDLISVLKTRE